METKLRQRIEMQATHAQQMDYKARRLQAEHDEEEQYRQQVVKQLSPFVKSPQTAH